MYSQIAVFNLVPDGPLYGTDINHISEISHLPNITPIPGVDATEGVFNFRGKVIPVYDLGKILGQSSQQGKIIVVDINQKPSGLIVHDVLEVYTVDESQVQPSPIEQPYITGIAHIKDDVIVVIQLENLLSAWQ